jgi:hypothetical protein
MLRIEHPIYDFDAWKASFDRYESLRVQSGVRRYVILQPVDDPKYVVVDLEFDSPAQAETLLAAVRGVWGQVEGQVFPAEASPKARIVEAVASKDY